MNHITIVGFGCRANNYVNQAWTQKTAEMITYLVMVPSTVWCATLDCGVSTVVVEIRRGDGLTGVCPNATVIHGR